MKNIIFITKDALRKDALPVYGNKIFKTPNIDELAQKGTVFSRHYTAAGSTAMAFTSMALGKYCYQTDRMLYDGTEGCENGNTVFDKLYELGYDVHIAWDNSYTDFAKTHFKCEGEHTTVHSLNSIIPHHSPHINGQFDDLTYKPFETEQALKIVEGLFKELFENKKPIFLWLHLPHVFAGRNAYDSDIDVFDSVIGMARNFFGDDSIYVSADHGQMNGHKGKYGYGYDVNEWVMNIPLITPKFQQKDIFDIPTTTLQLLEIFGLEPFKPHKFIICETAYYAQPMRKIAIMHDNYKLIYDKHTKSFELYDVVFDPLEENNLFYPEFYDVDRRCWYSLNQRFYYPYWKKAFEEKEILLNEFNSIWKNGTFFQELKQKIIFVLKLIYSRIMANKKKKSIINMGK